MASAGNVGAGAASGAAAGTMVMPGWGTLIGAGLGAAGAFLQPDAGRNYRKARDFAMTHTRSGANRFGAQFYGEPYLRLEELSRELAKYQAKDDDPHNVAMRQQLQQQIGQLVDEMGGSLYGRYGELPGKLDERQTAARGDFFTDLDSVTRYARGAQEFGEEPYRDFGRRSIDAARRERDIAVGDIAGRYAGRAARRGATSSADTMLAAGERAAYDRAYNQYVGDIEQRQAELVGSARQSGIDRYLSALSASALGKQQQRTADLAALTGLEKSVLDTYLGAAGTSATLDRNSYTGGTAGFAPTGSAAGDIGGMFQGVGGYLVGRDLERVFAQGGAGAKQ